MKEVTTGSDAIVTDQMRDNPNNNEQGERSKEDVTGRDHLASNVLFSWGAYVVFIVAGFVMPRMIDRRLGQDLLGIWDFAWSLVTYFGLVEAGIGSSVNRYVAQYRAAGDIPGVSGIVSSSSFILGVAGILVLALTVTLSLLLPPLFGDRLGEHVREAQWIVFLLGAGIGVQVSCSAFGGVLTGCHRWGLHNMVASGWYAGSTAATVVALLLGGKLQTLAAISLAREVLAGATRGILAHHVCGGLRLRLSLVQRVTVVRLLLFGGKSVIPSVASLLVNQTTSILIVAYLGPAALALYARPRALISHVQTLVIKMANVLTPTSSSLQSVGNLAEIQELLLTSMRYALYMVLPVVLVLVIFGATIMQLWMGPRYANGMLPAILALGGLAGIAQWPALTILGGLNAHGRAGMAGFIASLCAIGLTVLVLGYLKWGLVGAAVAVTLPLTIVNVTYVPIYTCRRVGLRLGKYLREIWRGPLLCSGPFALCLGLARILFEDEPVKAILYGCLAGGSVLAFAYWRYVIPRGLRIRVLNVTGLGKVAS